MATFKQRVTENGFVSDYVLSDGYLDTLLHAHLRARNAAMVKRDDSKIIVDPDRKSRQIMLEGKTGIFQDVISVNAPSEDPILTQISKRNR